MLFTSTRSVRIGKNCALCLGYRPRPTASAIANHITSTGHNIKWDHFDILATGRSDLHCKIKETLLIRELQPALNENVGSEKRFLY